MQIDRNERARIGVLIRKDDRLTPTAKHVAHTLLFFFMGALGQAWPSFETLAAEAGVSISSAKRAIPQLTAAGYLTKTQRRGKYPTKRGNRWVPTLLSNLYIWVQRLSVSSTQEPRLNIKKEPPAPLPAELATALARLINSAADSRGLPKVPSTA